MKDFGLSAAGDENRPKEMENVEKNRGLGCPMAPKCFSVVLTDRDGRTLLVADHVGHVEAEFGSSVLEEARECLVKVLEYTATRGSRLRPG